MHVVLHFIHFRVLYIFYFSCRVFAFSHYFKYQILNSDKELILFKISHSRVVLNSCKVWRNIIYLFSKAETHSYRSHSRFAMEMWCHRTNNVAMIYDYRRNKLHVLPLVLLAAHLRAAAAQRLHPYWVNTPRVRSISSPCRDTSVHRRSDLLTYKRQQVAENEDTGLVPWKPDRQQRAVRWDRIWRFSSAFDDCPECMIVISMRSLIIIVDKSSLSVPDVKWAMRKIHTTKILKLQPSQIWWNYIWVYTNYSINLIFREKMIRDVMCNETRNIEKNIHNSVRAIKQSWIISGAGYQRR